ncbi:MAG: homoserine dehydrogenase, partial [Planctomycetota bacterium]|nr:homoserine dehydrogenase [Planctomycetota bacterium]
GSMVCVGSDPETSQEKGTAPTLVGPQSSIRSEHAFPRFTRLRVAIAGHGTVGSGVLQHLLAAADDFEVTGVLVRDVDKHRGPNTDRVLGSNERFEELFTEDEEDFFARPFDVFLELAGGIQPAKGWIERALESGADVVSANKAVLSQHGGELHFVARGRGAKLLYSAAVGGAAPLLETAKRLASEPLRGFEAVLNGTTNHVVDSLSKGATLECAVEAAQDQGLAEADPTLDLNGTDSRQKTELLARELFGSDVLVRWGKQAPVHEITPDLLQKARAACSTVRLVASCYLEEGPSGLGPKRAFASLHPVLLPASHPLSPVAGAGAAVAFDPLDPRAERIVVSGTGAGRWPTAEAVLGDLFDLRHAPCRQALPTRN